MPTVLRAPTPLENRLPVECLELPETPNVASAILDKVKAARHEAMLIPQAHVALHDVGHAQQLSLTAVEHIDQHGDPLALRSGVGLNPYLIHLNRCRRRAKESKPPGYVTTAADQAKVVEEARQEWNEMSPAELQCFQDMHDVGVRRRQGVVPQDLAVALAAPTSYKPDIGIGTLSSAIDPAQFTEANLCVNET
jgi:hypothetical protein